MTLAYIYTLAHSVHCESFDSLQREDGEGGSFLVSCVTAKQLFTCS